jgi:hypothetical protein
MFHSAKSCENSPRIHFHIITDALSCITANLICFLFLFIDSSKCN